MNKDRALNDIDRMIKLARDSGDRAGQILRARQIQSYKHESACNSLVLEAKEVFNRCLLHDVEPSQVDAKIDESISTVIRKMIAAGIPITEDLRQTYAPNAVVVPFDPAATTTDNSTPNSTSSSNDEHNLGYVGGSHSDASRGEPEKSSHTDISETRTEMIHPRQSTPAVASSRGDAMGTAMANTSVKPKVMTSEQLDMSQIARPSYREGDGATANPRSAPKYDKRTDIVDPTQKWPENPPLTSGFTRNDQHGQPTRRFPNQKPDAGPR